MKVSHIEIKKRQREGYPGIIIYADIIIDGTSLFENIAHDFDFVSCLGWGSEEFQELQINRLLLKTPSDFTDNQNSIYICPACADLGCGAITVNIEIKEDTVTWSNLGNQDNHSDKLTYFDKVGNFIFIRRNYEEVISASRGIGSYKWPWDK
ncbi:hypothetical protein [Paenibacillus sinopodophylli]|uniref:hypothetical protein n=1 Tax=Paenibacillus sinopodophylli TaxID=1837342 RepID=UPI00110CC116|nr:hypothetical protein [Paenibacillus sinopodophylli]